MTEWDDWNEEERRAFERLDPHLAPPAGSEDQSVMGLQSAGMIPSRKRRRAVVLGFGVAAAAALFGAGLAIGLLAGAGKLRAAQPAGSPRFILFLFGDPTVTVDAERDRTAEYKKWASELRRGQFIAGETLSIGGHHLGSPPSDPRGAEGSELRGYFVIEAPDLVRATEVARTCPHLRHGGRILVRPIDPV